MEHIRHHRQTIGKLKAERERSLSLKNTERANESWSKLALDAKAVSTTRRRHFKVCPFTNLESYTTVPFVIIGLLPRLCCLEVLSDDPHLVFCLLDHIWTEQLPLTCLGPVQRCPALPAIQDLKGGCVQTCLIVVVVRELSIGQAFFPLHAKGDDTRSKHVLKDLIHTLNLPTGLRVISGTEQHYRTNRLLEGLPELGGEKTASTRADLLGNAVQRYNSCGIQIRQLSC